MRYSFAGIGMILMALFAFALIMIFQFVTIGNEGDYYSLKEAMEASMYESVDKAYYIKTGEIKIAQEKFVSNFTKRFIKNTMGNSVGYTLQFYDIMEYPPKATVVINDNVSSMSLSSGNFNVNNNLSGILEAKNPKDSSYYEDSSGKWCEYVPNGESDFFESTGEITLNNSTFSDGLELFGNSMSYISNIDISIAETNCDADSLSVYVSKFEKGKVYYTIASSDDKFAGCNVTLNLSGKITSYKEECS